jgi:Tfp pilus assembly protein PilX
MGTLETGTNRSLLAGEAVPDNRVYRVTARGVGGIASAEVVLQCTFKK